MTQVKIGGNSYPAIINGNLANKDWDGRATFCITVAMTYAQAAEIFTDSVAWSIVFDGVNPETGEPIHEEYDRSEYLLAGDITDHRDGTVSVLMGKLTDMEEVLLLLYGDDDKEAE